MGEGRTWRNILEGRPALGPVRGKAGGRRGERDRKSREPSQPRPLGSSSHGEDETVSTSWGRAG